MPGRRCNKLILFDNFRHAGDEASARQGKNRHHAAVFAEPFTPH
jgi:hypothetical protein